MLIVYLLTSILEYESRMSPLSSKLSDFIGTMIKDSELTLATFVGFLLHQVFLKLNSLYYFIY